MNKFVLNLNHAIMKVIKVKLYLLIFSIYVVNFSFSQNYLNEIIVKAVNPITSANNSLDFGTSPFGSEGIEIYNPHCSSLNISGWILVFNGSSNEMKGIYRFPNSTIIPVGGLLTIGAAGTTANHGGSDVAVASSIVLRGQSSTYYAMGDPNRLYLDNNRGYVALYNSSGTPMDCVYWHGTATGEDCGDWGSSQNGDTWDSSFGNGAGVVSAITNIPVGDIGISVLTSTLATPGSSSLNDVVRCAGNLTAAGTASAQNNGNGQSTISRVENITYGSNNVGTAIPCVLPVTWISFEALKNNRVSDLYWSTATETNNDYFEVERSKDVENWKKIGQVIGAGNTSYQMDYMFTDVNPYMGINYYRIKQVDYDGNLSYSDIRAVSFTGEMMLVPNPSNGNFTVVGMPENTTNSLQLINSLGQVISIVEIQSASCSFTDLNLASGVYYLTINNQETIKVCITKSN